MLSNYEELVSLEIDTGYFEEDEEEEEKDINEEPGQEGAYRRTTKFSKSKSS